MAINLTEDELNWIKYEYLSGRGIHDIVVDTGISASNIKRALAECGLMYLHWYKTKEENSMLEYLHSKDIRTLQELEQWV